MTSRDRLLKILRGESPDRVPFSPNIGQWFDCHKARGMLPPELADCKDETDAMLAMGCDIFSRRVGGAVRAKREGVETRSRKEDGWNVTEIVTPHGTLRGTSRWQAESHTSYEHEHYVKDWNDIKAFRCIVENTDYTFDPDAYRRIAERIGERGIPIMPLAPSPIKLFHIWAGQEQATMFMLDHPDEMRELADVHTEKVLQAARQGAESDALVFITGDNLDSLFHTPRLVREFAFDFYRRLADVLHAKGKYLLSHACGQLRGLKRLLAETGVDGVEGIPHPPLGDLPLPEAQRDVHDGFIVIGGMTCHEQEISENPRERIRDYVRTLFDQLRPFERFVFSSG